MATTTTTKATTATKATKQQRTRFNIEVTERDIERAKRNNSYKCVVSQAIARAIPDAHRIDTDTQAIRFTRHDQRYVYMTPYAVQGYVIAFDAGDEIRPFAFQLRDPARVKTRRLTAIGRAADKAKRRVYRKAESLGLAPSDPAVAAQARRAATAAYASVAPSGNEPRSTSKKGRNAPPRVFRRKTRSYGHRLLRINQQDDVTANEGPA